MTTRRVALAAAIGAAIAWSAMGVAQTTGVPRDQAAPPAGQRQEEADQGTTDPAGRARDIAQRARKDALRDSLQKLHATNQVEIALARAAQSRAQSAEVKEFASTMERQHARADRELQEEAQRMGVRLQGNAYRDALQDHRTDAQALQNERGAQFDRDFVSYMVDAHKRTAGDVHGSATRAADQGNPDLAELLGRTEATLLHHQALARQLQTRLEGQAAVQPAPGPGGTGAGQGAAATGAAGGAPLRGQEPVTPSAPNPPDRPTRP